MKDKEDSNLSPMQLRRKAYMRALYDLRDTYRTEFDLLLDRRFTELMKSDINQPKLPYNE